MTLSASNTANLHACSMGHDWQSVMSHGARPSPLAVLVVCRRCGDARWVGGVPEKGKKRRI